MSSSATQNNTRNSLNTIDAGIVITNHCSWDEMKFGERATCLRSLYVILSERQNEVSDVIVEDMGKSFDKAFDEVSKCLNHIKLTIDLIESQKLLNDEIHADPSNPKNNYLIKRYRPIGTVLVISPWNFPLWLAFKTIVSTILVGNKVVHKPSSQVPRVNKILDEIIQSSALPLGVWTISSMSYSEIENSIESDDIQAISFTGGTTAGRHIASLAGRALKPVVLELGGSDLMLVSEDYENCGHVAKVALRSRLHNNGQVCVATKRVALPNSEMKSLFTKAVIQELDGNLVLAAPEIRTRKNGDSVLYFNIEGADSDHYLLTRLANEVHFNESVKLLDELLKEESIEIIYGDVAWLEKAKSKTLPDLKNPLQFPPFVVGNVDCNSRFWNDVEFMCPVLLVNKPEQYEEILIKSQKPYVKYGLGGSVMLSANERETFVHEIKKEGSVTKKMNNLWDMRCGMMSINDAISSHSLIPFGGVNGSGFGKECGIEGIRSFTYLQTIQVPKKSPKPQTSEKKKNALSMPSYPRKLAGPKTLTKTLGDIGGIISSTAKAAGNMTARGKSFSNPDKNGNTSGTSSTKRSESYSNDMPIIIEDTIQECSAIQEPKSESTFDPAETSDGSDFKKQ